MSIPGSVGLAVLLLRGEKDKDRKGRPFPIAPAVLLLVPY